MKTKAFSLLLVYSFVAQILIAQKTGILYHTIILKLPQFAALSLTTNSDQSKLLKNNQNSLILKSSDIWLNYHSILNVVTPEPSKQIKAQITKGKINSIQSLTINTSKDSGTGIGNLGTPVKSSINLNNFNTKTIIDNIGIAYTGKDIFQGHKISYTFFFNKKNLSLVDQTSSSDFTITYTFLDN